MFSEYLSFVLALLLATEENPSYCHILSSANFEGSASKFSSPSLIPSNTEFSSTPAHHASDPGRTVRTYKPSDNRERVIPSDGDVGDVSVVAIIPSFFSSYSSCRRSPFVGAGVGIGVLGEGGSDDDDDNDDNED